jgi:hygromycin-B 4-O-kinase
MSTHKTELTLSDAKDFLSGYFNDDVTSVSEIGGGETSKAFFFKLKDADYVLRVNSHGKENYLKDKFAYQNFTSQNIPIPEVIEIGDVNESLSFCITKNVQA